MTKEECWNKNKTKLQLNERSYNSFEMGVKFYENKIADIKANCDYVLEGKEIEYREERNKLCADFENMKATLESKIAELEQQIEQMQDAKCTSCTDLGGLQLKITDLEKENAELKKKLKEKLKTIADKDLSFVAKFDALEKENAELKEQHKADLIQIQATLNLRNIQNTKLTKAIEIISAFVEWANWQGGKCPNFKSIQDKAEQFLEEIEK